MVTGTALNLALLFLSLSPLFLILCSSPLLNAVFWYFAFDLCFVSPPPFPHRSIYFSSCPYSYLISSATSPHYFFLFLSSSSNFVASSSCPLLLAVPPSWKISIATACQDTVVGERVNILLEGERQYLKKMQCVAR